MKLYNKDKQEWRQDNLKIGDSFRSTTIYQCKICHTKTNKWTIDGWLGNHPEISCPGGVYVEHRELEKHMVEHRNLSEEINKYESILKYALNINQESAQMIIEGIYTKKEGVMNVNQERAQKMMDNLYAKKELLTIQIEKIRGIFSNKLDDIVGLDLNAKTEYVIPKTNRFPHKKLT
ncbi:hypothetical protein HY643_01960 [Candidatus Woesearchaeota archaeon]|nr:hypothetical protein [Candidatus Woesearchaeota archaeon]